MTKSLFKNDTLQEIIDAIPIGLILVDKKGRLIFSNRKIEQLLDFNGKELLGLCVNDLVPLRMRIKHRKMLSQYVASPSPRPMDSGRILPVLDRRGEEIPVQIGLSPLSLEDAPFTLVSMIEATNPVLKVSSYNDPLTGLPNRAMFNEVSENLRELAIRNNDCLALMFIDLDKFKCVNDLYGHDIGDAVLCKVSDICTNNIRKNDVVGRVGGDEFVICFYGMENSEQLRYVSKNLVNEISTLKQVKGHQIDVGASIGAVFVSNPKIMPVDYMINLADKLMYKGKKANDGTVFSEEY